MTPQVDQVRTLLKAMVPRRIAIVGDVMLDRFVLGRVDRVSPEAPVPVVSVREEEERLGGAANVAANVAALGGQAIAFGVVGPGDAGQRIIASLGEQGLDTSGMLVCDDRVTSVKTRILAGNQQIVRIDRETKAPLIDATQAKLHELLSHHGPFDAVIVSDYGKGVVDRPLMDLLRAWHRNGCKVVVDPKQGNFDLYSGVTCITPNEREAAGACHASVETDAEAAAVARELQSRLSTDLLLLTRGEHGMMLLDPDGEVITLPTRARRVFDVTGAGDTVIAAFTSFLAAGAAPAVAAALANAAAGLVVGRLGTAVVTPDELCAAVSE